MSVEAESPYECMTTAIESNEHVWDKNQMGSWLFIQNPHLHKQFWVNLALMCHCNTFFTITRTRRIYLPWGFGFASSSIRNAISFSFFFRVRHTLKDVYAIQRQWCILIRQLLQKFCNQLRQVCLQIRWNLMQFWTGLEEKMNNIIFCLDCPSQLIKCS